MDIIYTQPLTKNGYTIMREAGYIPIQDRHSGKQSYVLRIGQGRYPRFHVYIEEDSYNRLSLHLHLDYRQHGWGQRLHDTDYDGDIVKNEAARLQRWLAHFTRKKID